MFYNEALAETELRRIVVPSVMTSFFDITLPLFEVISGSRTLANQARENYTQSVVTDLIDFVTMKIMGDISKKQNLLAWFQEGNVSKVRGRKKGGYATAAKKNHRLALTSVY